MKIVELSDIFHQWILLFTSLYPAVSVCNFQYIEGLFHGTASRPVTELESLSNTGKLSSSIMPVQSPGKTSYVAENMG